MYRKKCKVYVIYFKIKNRSLFYRYHFRIRNGESFFWYISWLSKDHLGTFDMLNNKYRREQHKTEQFNTS